MLKRWFARLLKVLLGLIVLLVVFLLVERWRGQWSLARYQSELKDKGEKLTLAEVIPPMPGGENGALEVADAAKKLKAGPIMPNRRPPAMTIVPSGRAIVWCQQNEWVEDKATNTWKQLAVELKENEAALAQIRTALAKPVLNNKLDYVQGFHTRFDHLPRVKSLAGWFGSASQLDLREGRSREAAADLTAQLRLTRALVEDRLVISELVRYASAAITRCSTWEALQSGGWTDEDLAALQRAWASENFMASLEISLEGERAFGLASQKGLRESNDEVAQAMFWQESLFGADEAASWWQQFPGRDFFKKQVYCRVWRFAWLDQDEQHYLEGMQRLLEIARAAATGKSYVAILPELESFAAGTAYRSILPEFGSSAAGTRNLGGYDRIRFAMSSQALASLSAVIRRGMRIETEKSMTVGAIAIKRYSLRYGKPPPSLESLVPEFLPAVPVDYMNGKPLKYQFVSTGSFLLYSVGQDGRDNGGDALPADKKNPNPSLWDRKDFVWPEPATPKEIDAWRKEAAKN